MSKIEHTPGPWRWFDRATLVGDHGDRPVVLAAVGDSLRQRSVANWLVSLDLESPDARLIVAAPELLNVLRGCAAAIEALIEERPAFAAKRVGSTTLGNHLAAARAIVARATEGK